MRSAAAEAFVDVMVQDSSLVNPADLLSALREPAGRKPGSSTLAVAEALSSIDDARALVITRSVLDFAYFSVLNLLDSGLKNSGIQVQIRTSSDEWLSDSPAAELHELYRERVEPNGFVRKLS